MISERKRLGAYYTPPAVVHNLVKWATRDVRDVNLLDPSCGDGRFIDGFPNAVGIDVDPDAIADAKRRSGDPVLINADFFQWARSSRRTFDAVVGNPPFIRYQHFSGESRRVALDYCKKQGVKLPGLASSWAPFVVGAASMVANGGRLALVIPAEIAYAVYARPVVKFLINTFEHVEICAIRNKIFPDLSEDCWLLRADGFGGSSDYVTISSTGKFKGEGTRWIRTDISTSEVAKNNHRLRPFLLDSDTRKIYMDLKISESVTTLGHIADLGIGYVTGANDFFHLTPTEADNLGISETHLRPAVRSNRDLNVADVTSEVIDGWLASDKPILLLDLSGVDQIPPNVVGYLRSSHGKKARQSYKCRNRNPWYQVPDVRVPDGFLTIMSSVGPRIVANSGRCVCTNSVHAVRLRNGMKIKNLVRLWDNPLTALSAEIEGHSLGGGVLKLEPREARNVLIPLNNYAIKGQNMTILSEALKNLRRWRQQRGS